MTPDPFPFDVALSYATENRGYVKPVASALDRHGVSVFYDQLFAADLFGVDLASYFDDVFRRKSRFVVVFASVHYRAKAWPMQELRDALAGAMERRPGRILPARLDDIELPGLPPTVHCVDCRHRTPDRLAALLVEKVREAR